MYASWSAEKRKKELKGGVTVLAAYKQENLSREKCPQNYQNYQFSQSNKVIIKDILSVGPLHNFKTKILRLGKNTIRFQFLW